jgi:hypothetical protein
MHTHVAINRRQTKNIIKVCKDMEKPLIWLMRIQNGMATLETSLVASQILKPELTT